MDDKIIKKTKSKEKRITYLYIVSTVTIKSETFLTRLIEVR